MAIRTLGSRRDCSKYNDSIISIIKRPLLRSILPIAILANLLSGRSSRLDAVPTEADNLLMLETIILGSHAVLPQTEGFRKEKGAF